MADTKPSVPPWKALFDAYHDNVGPALEQATRSADFARVATAVTRTERQLRNLGVAPWLMPTDLMSRVQDESERLLLAARNLVKPLPHPDGPPVAQTPRDDDLDPRPRRARTGTGPSGERTRRPCCS